ncbi:MAG: alpha-glucosidase [Treponema sp.]|nr:alpha-glucosidase [Treponema sp.]
MRSDWWKRSVVYQVYPRSFCDSNGDGIGDINGITLKLDYIKELGVDVIWVSPVYKSPMYDNGYDISDYKAINPEFGTMDDFDNLLKCAHEHELKIVMDLVVNHSSNEHPWFMESRSSRKNSKRDFYIWRDGIKNGNGLQPPNDWKAWFGGSAWTYDETTGQFYLGCFSPHQPDLNWENPKLRAEIYDMMRWWLDKGIDGFRLDAISFISKPQDFPDGNIKQLIPNGPRIHEFLKEMRRDVLSKYDVMTVGETGGVTVAEAVQYANAGGSELDMVFHFEQQELDGGETFKWNNRKIILTELKEVLSRWQNQLYEKAWNSLYWCNHDQPRIVSRLGEDSKGRTLREKSAKMLAACLHFMQGTPFIYQGEELAMTNAPFNGIADYRDLESINAYNTIVLEEKRISKDDMLAFMRLKSRDNSRTPMQWNNKHGAGFSHIPKHGSGGESSSQSELSSHETSSLREPWIMVNPNYHEINAEDQLLRMDSVFRFYRNLIQLRKTMDIITHGSYELLLPDDPDLFVYTRKYNEEELLVICNFSGKERTFPLPERFYGAEVLITNQDIVPKKELVLNAFGTSVYWRK